jgi:hypothetical protein
MGSSIVTAGSTNGAGSGCARSLGLAGSVVAASTFGAFSAVAASTRGGGSAKFIVVGFQSFLFLPKKSCGSK